MGMMAETFDLSIQCSQCGEGRLALRQALADDAAVACPSCGADLGHWAEVKEQARAAVFDVLRDDFAIPAAA